VSFKQRKPRPGPSGGKEAFVSSRLPTVIGGRANAGPPPELGKRRHRGLPRRLITKGWRTPLVFVRCPHPGSVLRRGRRQEYPPHYDAVLQHVVIVIPPSPETAQAKGDDARTEDRGAPGAQLGRTRFLLRRHSHPGPLLLPRASPPAEPAEARQDRPRRSRSTLHYARFRPARQ
jgi:hypothetical protein